MARSSGFLDTLLTSDSTERYRIGFSLLFLLGVWLVVGAFSEGMPNSTLLMAAAVIGGYMAINIGANDVANNVGPAVGSGALSLGAAVILAGIFESAGALIAGGDVVSTIKGGIIDPTSLEDGRAFVWLMTAALLAGALWLNLATWMGAPVSTTHSIVGGVLGAGIAAGGWGIADWGVMAKIAGSWVISPVLGGALAALLLYVKTQLGQDTYHLSWFNINSNNITNFRDWQCNWRACWQMLKIFGRDYLSCFPASNTGD